MRARCVARAMHSEDIFVGKHADVTYMLERALHALKFVLDICYHEFLGL